MSVPCSSHKLDQISCKFNKVGCPCVGTSVLMVRIVPFEAVVSPGLHGNFRFKVSELSLCGKETFKTRMHSNRMRTGRSLTVCRGVLPSRGGASLQGGCFLPGGGGCALSQGLSFRGGASFPGGWYPSKH